MPIDVKSETPLAAAKPSTTLSSTSPEVTIPELAWALELPPVLTTLLRRTMAPPVPSGVAGMDEAARDAASGSHAGSACA